MCVTYSGRLIMPTNYGVPSALDIAVSLGRECRWTGSLREWWSVLHHLRAMMYLAVHLFDLPDEQHVPAPVRAHILLHDAHEAVLRDVPTTWKTEAQREQERNLDRRIYEAYLGGPPVAHVASQVQALDQLCLRGEAATLTHERAAFCAGIDLDYRPHVTTMAQDVVYRVLGQYEGPASSAAAMGSPLVRWYLQALRQAVPANRWAVFGESGHKPTQDPFDA